MEQKQNGKLPNKTKEIYKLVLSLLMSFSFSFCQGQKTNIIDKKYSIVDFAERSVEKEGIQLFKSGRIADFLGTKSTFFLNKGGSLLGDKISINEIVSINDFSDLVMDKKRERFLFITDFKEYIKDTLKISRGYDYSVCQLDKEGKEFGIAIGKYHIKNDNHYFEIHLIYSIFDYKLKRESLSRILYDCTPPNDYISEEEPNSFFYGIRNGKKYTRFWYE